MTSLLSRACWPQAVGIYFDGTTAHACRVTATPLGIVEQAQCSETVDPRNPRESFDRLIVAAAGQRNKRLPVALGVPTERTYFSTRPINAGGADASPRVLLREALRSSNVPVDDMLVDVVTTQPNGRRLASMAACNKEFIEPILESLKSSNLRLVRAEPAACVLLRRALRQQRRNRQRMTCHCFLNDTHALGVIAAGGNPVVWRQTRLARGDEAATIVTAVRSLASVGERSGLEGPPEAVVVHGRSELPRLLDMDWIREQVSAPLEWQDGPEWDDSKIARGLAEACLGESGGGIDLAKAHEPPASMLELFPWRQAAIQAAVLIAVVLALFWRLLAVQDAQAAVSIRNAQSTYGSQSVPELEKEKKELQQRVSAVRKFLDSRVLWADHERALAASLPDNVFLTSVNGVSELSTGEKAKKKPKKQLVLQGAVSLPGNGLIPHEVDRFLNTLRSQPVLKRDFPVIELAELKQIKNITDGGTQALFTVVCFPKGGQQGK